jgi:PAS domain S-box-containing protein
MAAAQLLRADESVAKSTESFESEIRAFPVPDEHGPSRLVADWPVFSAAILDQFPASVITTDLEGTITSCNPCTERLYGYTTTELIGKNVALLSGEFSDGPDSLLNRKLVNEHFQGNVSQRTKSGRTINFLASITPLRGNDSEPAGFLILSFDPAQSETDAQALANAAHTTESSAVAARAVVVERELDGTRFIIASLLMHKFMSLVDRIATHNETVLITGETGTGKEMVAHTIHKSSFRSKLPFVEINCAALPEHLVESELFGYEKGAFSGADACKPGLFEMADKGTLFLDEIGELPAHIQVKLLRVLDGKAYYRLGGNRQVKVDVRVVAATNQNLEAAVKEGRFRKDLFHRISQFHLRVPPLRERPDDIAVLARHFLNLKAPGKNFSEEALRKLQAHSWMGNIRELRNVIAKLTVESAAEKIGVEEVAAEIAQQAEHAPPATTSAATPEYAVALDNGTGLEAMEEQMIRKALERTGGHRAQAAEQLGISRRTLSRKLREYQINSPAGEKPPSLGALGVEQQKTYRVKVQFPVSLKNSSGEAMQVNAVNLSASGIGVEGLNRAAKWEGALQVSFVLPDEDIPIEAQACIAWSESGGLAGIRLAGLPAPTMAKLQQWVNRKMKQDGWELMQ